MRDRYCPLIPPVVYLYKNIAAIPLIAVVVLLNIGIITLNQQLCKSDDSSLFYIIRDLQDI
jgi:hypothetical protein